MQEAWGICNPCRLPVQTYSAIDTNPEVETIKEFGASCSDALCTSRDKNLKTNLKTKTIDSLYRLAKCPLLV